jgi:hypothetical protein
MIAIDSDETYEFLIVGFRRPAMLVLIDVLVGGDAGETGIRLLGRLLSSSSGEVIRHCCAALETFKEGVPLIVNESFEAYARERGSTAGGALFRLLVRIGSEDFSAIAGGLDHNILYVRESGVRVLRRLSSTQQLEASPEELRSYYERASSLEDADVKAALLLLRADMAKGDDERQQILLAGLLSHSKKIRRAAALALGRMGALAKTCVPALEKLLEDDKVSVRIAARSALDTINASPGKAGQ